MHEWCTPSFISVRILFSDNSRFSDGKYSNVQDWTFDDYNLSFKDKFHRNFSRPFERNGHGRLRSFESHSMLERLNEKQEGEEEGEMKQKEMGQGMGVGEQRAAEGKTVATLNSQKGHLLAGRRLPSGESTRERRDYRSNCRRQRGVKGARAVRGKGRTVDALRIKRTIWQVREGKGERAKGKYARAPLGRGLPYRESTRNRDGHR